MLSDQDSRPPDPPHDPRPALSKQDKDHLTRMNKKLQVLSDRVEGVAKGYYDGVIISGRGGTGKSFRVAEELERLGVSWQLTNSHLTPRGLFDLLDAHRDAIHVIEDAEEITRNKVALGVLRSALWGSRKDRQGRRERRITWKTHRESLEIGFSGGVILILNRSLSDLPEAKALATRVPYLEVCVSDQEIAAMMRKVALEGYQYGDAVLDAMECLEVADYIIAESANLNRTLDMRLLVNAYRDRLQEEDCDSGCTWQDLVFSTMCGQPSVASDVESVGLREQRKARELEIARQILSLDPVERLAAWQRKAGKSQATLYRRLAELGRIDAQEFDN